MATGDWFDANGTGSPVDVRQLLDGIPLQGIQELVELGALVSMGTTSDGGALGVTVTVDGRWRREYFRDAAALTTWLGEAIPAVAETSTRRLPAAPRQRSRRSRSA